jgi:hypothetical protein
MHWSCSSQNVLNRTWVKKNGAARQYYLHLYVTALPYKWVKNCVNRIHNVTICVILRKQTPCIISNKIYNSVSYNFLIKCFRITNGLLRFFNYQFLHEKYFVVSFRFYSQLSCNRKYYWRINISVRLFLKMFTLNHWFFNNNCSRKSNIERAC